MLLTLIKMWGYSSENSVISDPELLLPMEDWSHSVGKIEVCTYHRELPEEEN